MFQEESARADAYALISQLFRAPPGADFLRLYTPRPADPAVRFTLQEPQLTGYDAALRQFQNACGEHAVESIAHEYETLFHSLRNSLASPAAPHAIDTLRDHLRACGLITTTTGTGVEFYVCGVCDVLRWLIEHDRPHSIQMAFFKDFVETPIGSICDAIDATAEARFYTAVANLTRGFMQWEKQKFIDAS